VVVVVWYEQESEAITSPSALRLDLRAYIAVLAAISILARSAKT
jgi:hypothetical protein